MGLLKKSKHDKKSKAESVSGPASASAGTTGSSTSTASAAASSSSAEPSKKDAASTSSSPAGSVRQKLKSRLRDPALSSINAASASSVSPKGHQLQHDSDFVDEDLSPTPVESSTGRKSGRKRAGNNSSNNTESETAIEDFSTKSSSSSSKRKHHSSSGERSRTKDEHSGSTRDRSNHDRESSEISAHSVVLTTHGSGVPDDGKSPTAVSRLRFPAIVAVAQPETSRKRVTSVFSSQEFGSDDFNDAFLVPVAPQGRSPQPARPTTGQTVLPSAAVLRRELSVMANKNSNDFEIDDDSSDAESVSSEKHKDSRHGVDSATAENTFEELSTTETLLTLDGTNSDAENTAASENPSLETSHHSSSRSRSKKRSKPKNPVDLSQTDIVGQADASTSEGDSKSSRSRSHRSSRVHKDRKSRRKDRSSSPTTDARTQLSSESEAVRHKNSESDSEHSNDDSVDEYLRMRKLQKSSDAALRATARAYPQLSNTTLKRSRLCKASVEDHFKHIFDELREKGAYNPVQERREQRRLDMKTRMEEEEAAERKRQDREKRRLQLEEETRRRRAAQARTRTDENSTSLPKQGDRATALLTAHSGDLDHDEGEDFFLEMTRKAAKLKREEQHEERKHQRGSHSQKPESLPPPEDALPLVAPLDWETEVFHMFEKYVFSSPTECDCCKKTVWGKGSRCKRCKFALHKKCLREGTFDLVCVLRPPEPEKQSSFAELPLDEIDAGSPPDSVKSPTQHHRKFFKATRLVGGFVRNAPSHVATALRREGRKSVHQGAGPVIDPVEANRSDQAAAPEQELASMPKVPVPTVVELSVHDRALLDAMVIEDKIESSKSVEVRANELAADTKKLLESQSARMKQLDQSAAKLEKLVAKSMMGKHASLIRRAGEATAEVMESSHDVENDFRDSLRVLGRETSAMVTECGKGIQKLEKDLLEFEKQHAKAEKAAARSSGARFKSGVWSFILMIWLLIPFIPKPSQLAGQDEDRPADGLPGADATGRHAPQVEQLNDDDLNLPSSLYEHMPTRKNPALSQLNPALSQLGRSSTSDGIVRRRRGARGGDLLKGIKSNARVPDPSADGVQPIKTEVVPESGSNKSSAESAELHSLDPLVEMHQQYQDFMKFQFDQMQRLIAKPEDIAKEETVTPSM